MPIIYASEPGLSAEDFRDILIASTLGERRPIHDMERLTHMLSNADIVLTARDGRKLVGISRAITDFSYCCYLSDLAVKVDYQGQGIGKQLVEKTHEQAGKSTTLVLISAPAAEKYYPKIGMKHMTSCWAIPRIK